MSAAAFRWAVVTGASSGIGAAFARALAARGERLVLVARREDRLRALAQELGGEEKALVLPADLARPEACARLADELARRGVEVDLLVNNAGVGHSSAVHEQPLERMLGMIDLNVRAAVELTRRVLPGMVERQRGRIVNVVSTSAFQPIPFLAVYAASKAFLLSFTEALADELAGTGVRVQALCPGLTESEFQQVAGTDAVAFARTPAMTPEAVAARSLEALDQGALRVVPGLANRLVIATQSLLPRALVRRVAGELFRPRPPRQG
jgi:short-subunit dehydrogenase